MFTVVWASIAPALKSNTTRSLQALSSAMERSNNICQMWGGGGGRIKSNFDNECQEKERKLFTILSPPPHTHQNILRHSGSIRLFQTLLSDLELGFPVKLWPHISHFCFLFSPFPHTSLFLSVSGIAISTSHTSHPYPQKHQ